MPKTPEELSPLAAYEELMRFAKKSGEAALRLALHASVPQGFNPDLLHLLKRNFVPEAGDDPTIEVDVLFSPICEDLGRGYFRFDPHVKIQKARSSLFPNWSIELPENAMTMSRSLESSGYRRGYARQSLANSDL